MARPTCSKCGGRIVYEAYPAEDMLVTKCFVCGKIDNYRELTRDEVHRIFRRVDASVVAEKLAS